MRRGDRTPSLEKDEFTDRLTNAILYYVNSGQKDMLDFMISANLEGGNVNRVAHVLDVLDVPRDDLSLKQRVVLYQLLGGVGNERLD